MNAYHIDRILTDSWDIPYAVLLTRGELHYYYSIHDFSPQSSLKLDSRHELLLDRNRKEVCVKPLKNPHTLHAPEANVYPDKAIFGNPIVARLFQHAQERQFFVCSRISYYLVQPTLESFLIAAAFKKERSILDTFM